MLDGAERQARAVIAEWPDGEYEGVAHLDDDGHGFHDIHIRARVTVRGGDLRVDLSDSHPQVLGFVNSSYPNMRSAVAMALAYLIDPDTPKNDGTFRPLEVIAKEGTVVWAREGAPVTLATNHCAQEIMEAIMRALAPACPERVMAGWGRRFRIAIQGTDPRNGRSFIWHMFHARPGGGASSAGDGWPAGGEWQAAGGIKFGSVEVAEVRFPLFFRRHELRPDSGGDGRYRGGPGCELELELRTEGPAVGNTAGGRGEVSGVRDERRARRAAPPLHAALAGAAHAGAEDQGGGNRAQAGGRDPRALRRGRGGWGDPGERSAEASRRDRRDGFVTRFDEPRCRSFAAGIGVESIAGRGSPAGTGISLMVPDAPGAAEFPGRNHRARYFLSSLIGTTEFLNWPGCRFQSVGH